MVLGAKESVFKSKEHANSLKSVERPKKNKDRKVFIEFGEKLMSLPRMALVEGGWEQVTQQWAEGEGVMRGQDSFRVNVGQAVWT